MKLRRVDREMEKPTGILDECEMDWDYGCDPTRMTPGWICNRGPEHCSAAVPKYPVEETK